MFEQLIGDKRPIGWVIHFWPVLVVSFAGSLAATWLCKRVAIKFGIVDRPDDLVKTHKKPIAYLGGDADWVDNRRAGGHWLSIARRILQPSA